MFIPLTFNDPSQQRFTLQDVMRALQARGLDAHFKEQDDGDVYLHIPASFVEASITLEAGIVTQALVWSFTAPRSAMMDVIEEILNELGAGEPRNDGIVLNLRR